MLGRRVHMYALQYWIVILVGSRTLMTCFFHGLLTSPSIQFTWLCVGRQVCCRVFVALVRPAGLCADTGYQPPTYVPLCRIGSFVSHCLIRCVCIPSVSLCGMWSGRARGEQLYSIWDFRFLWQWWCRLWSSGLWSRVPWRWGRYVLPKPTPQSRRQHSTLCKTVTA